MMLVDDRVLEYLNEHDAGSPQKMKEEGKIRYSPQYISQRCKELAKRGLVKHLGNAVYVITDDGERYLAGELDTGKFDEEDDNGERASA